MPMLTEQRDLLRFADDIHAPGFALYVNGSELQTDVTDHVLSIRYEESVEMASMLRLHLDNSYHRFTDSPIFTHGVEVDVYMGYGNAIDHLGRCELHKHLPNFPESGAPTLEIVGYDALVRLNHNEVRTGDDTKRKETEKQGKIYKGTVGTAVTEVFASKYGFLPKIDPEFMTRPLPGALPGQVGHTLQKRDTPDAEFLRALATMVDAELFVRYEFAIPAVARVPNYIRRRAAASFVPPVVPAGKWIAYFRKPNRTAFDSYCVFRYGAGDQSTILRVDLDFGITGRVTEVTVLYKNKITGYYEAVTEGKEASLTSPQYKTLTEKRNIPSWQVAAVLRSREARGGKVKGAITEGELSPFKGLSPAASAKIARQYGKGAFDTSRRTIRKKVLARGPKAGTFQAGGPAFVGKAKGEDGEVTAYHPIRILAGGHAFDVNPGRKFRTAAEAVAYAKAWFERHRDSLIVARGTLVGYEKLRAGTVHRIEGIGSRYSGDYYFITVGHEWSGDGYVTDFVARKVLDS